MFEVVDDTDGDFDIADNEDGDNAKKNSVDDQEDTIEGVENNGDDSTTNEEPTTADTARFFFGIFNADLPTFVFLRGALLFFAMVAMNVGFLVMLQEEVYFSEDATVVRCFSWDQGPIPIDDPSPTGGHQSYAFLKGIL